jgi:hypothetical protein
MFHATIFAIEGEKVTLVEAKSIIESLLEKLQQRRGNDFATRKEQFLSKVLIEDGLITEKNYGNYKNEFYNTCIEYIQEWSSDTLTFESLSWILLKNPEASLSWKSVQKSVTTIEEVCPNTKINETELFDEVMILEKAITDKEEMKAKSTGEIWYELFNSFGVNELVNLKKIVEFFRCIPGTNTSIESLFSQMNSLWTNEKNKLSFETVKAMIIVKVFFNKDCVEFHNLVKHNHSLLEKIQSSEKYITGKDQ